MDSLTGKIGREYLRVSATGERSIPEQHDDNVLSAQREGVTLAEPYQDQGSASKYAQRGRDDFDRLMSDLQNGAFDASILWLWESSRGTRRMGEWASLLDLCEDRGILIHVTSHERTYNPANYRDRETLLTDGVNSEIEARRLSARTVRAINANARDGKPHGICPFGFQRDYEVRRGKLVPTRQYAHPEHAPLIVELFERVWAEDAFMAIEADWKKRGIVSRDRMVKGKPVPGIPFSAATLRTMITNAAYVGLRNNKGTLVKASWDGLVSEALFWDVQSLISDPSRINHRPGGAHHAFTSALVCDKCSGPATVRYDRKEPQYECKKGCWRASKAEIDAILLGDAGQPGVILEYLARRDVYEALDADDESGEAAEIRGALARARTDLKEVEAAAPETLAEERRFARRTERLEAQIAELQKRRDELARPTKLSTLFQPGPDVAGRWDRAPVSTQRAIAQLLLSPAFIGQPRMKQIAVSASAAVVDRIEWRHATDGTPSPADGG